MKKFLLIFWFFLAGCANVDFPFCCDPVGDKNVPYTDTYLFNKTLVNITVNQALSITGSQTFLTIISQADLANLFNAANVSIIPGAGTVSGNIVSFGGGGVSNVVLEATDANGNIIGDLFYNSLGGIPDFSTTSGSSASGGFTLLNAPPGEVYLKAIQGGRGQTSVLSIGGAVSLTDIRVVPVIQPLIGVTGGVQEYGTGAPVLNALLTPAGLQGLAVFGSSGRYRFPSLGSDSNFIIESTASGYLPTYQGLFTDLSALPAGAVDVTSNLELFSQTELQDTLTQTRFQSAYDSSKGVLVGTARDPDGSNRGYSSVVLTDDRGTSLNIDPATSKSRVYHKGSYTDPLSGASFPTYFWFDPTGTQASYLDSNFNIQTYDCTKTLGKTCPPGTLGSLDGTFIAFNLPSGNVHLSVTALEDSAQGLLYYTGEENVDIFPASASIKDVSMNQVALGASGFFQNFGGTVTESDGKTPVSFATIFALGNAPSLTTADLYGYFNIPMNAKIFLDQASYTIKVSSSSYFDTYQEVKIDNTSKNLSLYSTSLINQYLGHAGGLSSQVDVTKGILTGIIIDNISSRGTGGISVQATDIGGNRVGDIRYFDSSGLPSDNTTSSKNGKYIIFNLPPGLIQLRVVSPDDSGNQWVHVFAGGIVLSDIHVNNAPPPSLQVSGLTQDIDGSNVGNGSLSVMGEKTRFTSGSDGSFSLSLSPFGQHTVKARAPQSTALDTYTLFDTTASDVSQMTIWAVTSTAVQSQVKNETFTVDFSKGILSGSVTSSGLAAPQPISPYQSSSLPLGEFSSQRMAAGLFDQDNEVDIALVNSVDNTLTVLLGGGDGTFRESPGSPYCLPRGTSLLSAQGQTCSSGASPVSVRPVDINGDGITDLIVANKGTDSITVLLGTRNGSFIPAGPPLSLPAGSAPTAISVGDFNNDQKIDLVVLGSGNNIFYAILGNGDGTFGAAKYSFFSGGSAPVAVLSRDFNGDGNLDLAIVNQGSNSVSIFLGLGNGDFISAPNSPILVGSNPVAVASNDLNGDGRSDLVIANHGSGTLTVLMGTGGGIFTSARGSPVLLSGPPESVTLNDLNLDGNQDIVLTTTSGNVLVLPGIGDGTFGSETAYPVGGHPSNVLIADFNDDLFSDLVVYQKDSGGVSRLAFLAGKETPLPNVTLEALDLAGTRVGDIRYLDAGGTILPGGQTDSSGRFIVYNVPSGIKNIHVTQGASGNRFLTSYQSGATFGNIPAIAPRAAPIPFGGTTVDEVGDSVVRNVENVQISVLGTGAQIYSDPVSAAFNFSMDANNSFFIKLHR
ncbi:MAG: FG-GAP-like repeat-containing protein [Nitrospiria bacterium]